MQTHAVTKTVWATHAIDEYALEDELDTLGVFSTVETLFAQKVIQRQKPASQAKKTEIQIINHKKAYNIHITLLSKLKPLTMTQIRQAVLAVDDAVVTENVLMHLQTNAPTAEEQGNLSVFVKSASEEDLQRLSIPDMFCVEVKKKILRTKTDFVLTVFC
jgi:cytokinesis protein